MRLEVVYLNYETITKMLELAGSSYGESHPVLDEKRVIQIDNFQTGIQCQIYEYQDRLVIAFRGSDSWKDAKTDIKVFKCKIPFNETDKKIKVHCGFISSYQCYNIREKIRSLVTPNIKYIQITGHSYGAALAILCAFDLQYCFPNADYEVVVFGCPRVGNRAFKKEYERRIFKTVRIENGNDAVIKVPSRLWGYRHVGACVHIGKLRIFGLMSFKSHHVQEYYGRLLEHICC